MNSTSEPNPTYFGFIESTYDALLLFEACAAGQIKQVSRRLHELERARVIRSGSIFIYEENTSGIKRWTDGIQWSPSRILGNFLIYRQLTKALGPGEKKRAIKKSKTGFNGDNSNNKRVRENDFQAMNNLSTIGGSNDRADMITLETERTLIGSLIDSYDFLHDGLVKKTISINYAGAAHHLVSYYTVSDAVSQHFMVPSKDPRFAHTYPRLSLLSSRNFRNAIEIIDSTERPKYPNHRYEVINQNFLQSPIPKIPALGKYTHNVGTSNRLYNFDSKISMPSIPYDRSAYTSTAGFKDEHVANFDAYSVLKRPEIPLDNHQQLIFGGTFNLESSRATSHIARDLDANVSSLYRGALEDSGILMPIKETIQVSSLSDNPNSFNSFARNVIYAANSNIMHKISPSSLDEDFGSLIRSEMPLPQSKHCTSICLDDRNTWPIGNASAGHGHYQNL